MTKTPPMMQDRDKRALLNKLRFASDVAQIRSFSLQVGEIIEHGKSRQLKTRRDASQKPVIISASRLSSMAEISVARRNGRYGEQQGYWTECARENPEIGSETHAHDNYVMVDVSHTFKDPDAITKWSTGLDRDVQRSMLTLTLVPRWNELVSLVEWTTQHGIGLVVTCAKGRHRSVAVAEILASYAGFDVFHSSLAARLRDSEQLALLACPPASFFTERPERVRLVSSTQQANLRNNIRQERSLVMSLCKSWMKLAVEQVKLAENEIEKQKQRVREYLNDEPFEGDLWNGQIPPECLLDEADVAADPYEQFPVLPAAGYEGVFDPEGP